MNFVSFGKGVFNVEWFSISINDSSRTIIIIILPSGELSITTKDQFHWHRLNIILALNIK